MCNTILDPWDCSLGQLKQSLNESDRINSGGTYLLPDEVSCNGNLVSLHTCFFYNDEGNSSNNDFRLRVGVFRRMGDHYVQNGRISIDVTRHNSSETQGCTSMCLTDPVSVLEGDRIAVRIRQRCSPQFGCPLHANLIASGSMSVFFTRTLVTSIPVTQVMATENYTNVFLDVRASIGKLNVFHGGRTSRILSLEADVVLKSFLLFIQLLMKLWIHAIAS